MSGPGGKPRTQTAPTLSQKGKVTTTRQNRSAEPEAQEQGKTRVMGTVEMEEDSQEIGDAEKGKAFLEDRLLFVPDGVPLTLDVLSTTLFQVAAMPGMGRQAINAVRAVAYLLKEVEMGEVAERIRDIANTQFNEMTNDLKEFTEGLKEKMSGELEKGTAALEKKTGELVEAVEKAAQQAGNIGNAPYRDALTRAISGAPLDANPRLAAKESIRQ